MSPRTYIKKPKKRRKRDPFQFDPKVGLRYTTDKQPGFKRSGACFADTTGEIIDDIKTVSRIRAINIPKHWRMVWISPYHNGHLQATGIETNRRRATLFHPRWLRLRDYNRFDRLKLFAATLPAIRERISYDLVLPGLTRDKALAAIVRLLDFTHLHALPQQLEGNARIMFGGRKSVRSVLSLSELRMQNAAATMLDLPGQHVLDFIDHHGSRHSISSTDVNEYIATLSGGDFGIRDLRSWTATVLTCKMLLKLEPVTSEEQAAANVLEITGAVAKRLAHSPSICRRGHIHSSVLEHYLHGSLSNFAPNYDSPPDPSPYALRPDERAILTLLDHKIEPPAPAAVAHADPASNSAGEPNAPEHP